MFDLVVRLDEAHRRSIDDNRNLFIDLEDGNQVPLKEVADISYQPGPMQISRENTNRRTYVGINVEGRDVKSLVQEIQITLERELELPPGYYIRYGGVFENLERATKRLSYVVPLALALIFVLVFFAVKSLKHTLLIYVAVPFAAVGGVFSLYFRDMPFSISAGVGFIVLFGVAVLNGLVLINGLNELKSGGGYSNLTDMIKKGSVRRIRPIFLTATTDILGFLPMAVSASAGAEVQRPLATVVIGGMITSTFLTLVVLPVLYKYVESNMSKVKKPKLSKAILIVFLMSCGLVFSNKSLAQDDTITFQQAIELAKTKYPAVKAAQLEVDKQEALKSTAYDLGFTSVYSGKEETGNGFDGVQTQIGVEQTDIDMLGIPVKSRLARSRSELAQSGQILTESVLIRDVSKAYYRVVFALQQWQLYTQLDTLYTDFLRAAELRYNTQQTSRIEFLAASLRDKELRVNLRKAKSAYKADLEVLNQYLSRPDQFSIDVNSAVQSADFNNLEKDSLPGSPLLNYYSQSVNLANSEWMVEKAGYLPRFSLAYEKQRVEGIPGFYSYQAGISFPLLYFNQKGKTVSKRIDYQIAARTYEQINLEMQASYKEKMINYYALKEVILFYTEEALPLADEQIQASTLAYRLGNIDYVQFIQNVETAINTKNEFLKQQIAYLELAAELKYITGN